MLSSPCINIIYPNTTPPPDPTLNAHRPNNTITMVVIVQYVSAFVVLPTLVPQQIVITYIIGPFACSTKLGTNPESFNKCRDIKITTRQAEERISKIPALGNQVANVSYTLCVTFLCCFI